MAPKGTKHPAQLKPPLPAVLHAHPAALRRAQRRRSATGAPVWPWQGPPPPHRSRCRAPDIALRRQLPRDPYPSPAPPCARVPPSQHAQLPAEPAGGSQLPSPPPSRVGRRSAIIAAFTSHSPVICISECTAGSTPILIITTIDKHTVDVSAFIAVTVS